MNSADKCYILDIGGTIHKDGKKVNEFIKEIGHLQAKNGGDCPEYALAGMFAAVALGPVYGSPLYVFTDASPKDGDEANMFLPLAENYGTTVIFFMHESCSVPPDSTFEIYKQLAHDTGGQYLKIQEIEMKSLANFTEMGLGKLNTYCVQVSSGTADLYSWEEKGGERDTHKNTYCPFLVWHISLHF
jgi:hypothetical protein